MNKKGAYLLWAWFCLSYMPKPCLIYLIIYFFTTAQSVTTIKCNVIMQNSNQNTCEL